MKKYITSMGLAVAFVAMLFVAAPTQAHAAVSWNNDPSDCPTVMMGTYPTNENVVPPCWNNATTTHAAPTQSVNVRIFYHNTGSTPATNTVIHLTSPSGTSTSQSFSASVSSGGVSTSGTGTALLSSAQTLTYSAMTWYPDNGTVGARSITNGTDIFGAGLNIGTVDVNCPSSPGCHSGTIVVSFVVGNTTNTGGANCVINSFPSPAPITTGSSATLSWSTSNCNSVSIAGGNITGNYPTSGSQSTGALSATTTYVLTASGTGGTHQMSAVVNVHPATVACTIGGFVPNPTTIDSGAAASLSWVTNGCTSVSIAGGNITGNYPTSGNKSTGPLTQTTTYTLTATGADGSHIASTTVNVNPIVTPNCAVTGFMAGALSVPMGGSTTLSWSTSNCTSVTVVGPNFSSALLSANAQPIGPINATSTYTISAYGANGAHATAAPVTVSVTNTATCAILSFAPAMTTVTSGGYTTLSWNTSNCTNVQVTGPNFNSTQRSDTQTIGPITSFSTYYITAYGADGRTVTQTTSVGVTAALNCLINSFSPASGTTSLTSGTSTTLSWSTSNCTNLSLNGGIYNNAPVTGTSITTGPVTATTTYTLTASGTNTDTRSTIVYVTSAPTCTINSFYATSPTVPAGNLGSLNWTTTGCTSVNVYGIGINSNLTNGYAVPTGAIYGGNSFSITASSASNTAPMQTVYISAQQQQSLYACSDGVDNDGDGYIDYPADPGCTSAFDTDEYNSSIQTNSAPFVTTYAATNVLDASATLNGYINSNNVTCAYGTYCNPTYSYTNYYFQYGTNPNSLGLQTPSQSFSPTSGNVSAYVTGLQSNTTYYFRIVGSNSYGTNYGSVLSFVTTGNNFVSNVVVTTTIASNITTASARLNGLVYVPQNNGATSVYFDYGTSPSLGFKTNQQNVATNVTSNYFDTIAVTPNTTYYFRIVALVNGVPTYGSTVSFLSASNTQVTPPTVITQTVFGTGGGSAFVSLAITDQAQSVSAGDTINYIVTYQNISNVILSNVVLNVILPAGVTFRQSSQGVLTTTNTVAVSLGTLPPNLPQGTITIAAVADDTIVVGNNLVTTATMAFTIPSNAQDSAVAYDLSNVTTRNSLAGLALFGTGFFPNSLFGWIILLLLILILILIARYFYHRANAQKLAATPVTHVHYETPMGTPVSPNMGNVNYPNNNLPH